MNINSIKSVIRQIFALVIFGIEGGAYAGEVTLCQPHEEIYFSCPVGGKIVSLCASGNISPNNGYVQYRFGAVNRIELQFPGKPYPPNGYFEISDVYFGNLDYVHVKFKSGIYNYVIYQGDRSGVYVKKNGILVSNRVCENGVYQKLNNRVFRGIRTVPLVDGVDD
ncbi:hypothetical protein [Burkholderia latens]|uniref:hypothetical protein n=1 Tax=Burkholderia latens TaxID=488446 RepID=UPI0012E363C0|nr:hypothetical protein [Burkholderia latens]